MELHLNEWLTHAWGEGTNFYAVFRFYNSAILSEVKFEKFLSYVTMRAQIVARHLQNLEAKNATSIYYLSNFFDQLGMATEPKITLRTRLET